MWKGQCWNDVDFGTKYLFTSGPQEVALEVSQIILVKNVMKKMSSNNLPHKDDNVSSGSQGFILDQMICCEYLEYYVVNT